MKLTPQAAAKYLGVSADTLRRWANDGKITVERTPGGHRRYDIDEIKRVLDSEVRQLHGAEQLPTIDDPYNPAGLIPLGVIESAGSDRRIVGMRNADLDQHMFYCGRTGSGKTELMKWQMLGVAKAGYPIVVIDPHGALSDDLIDALARHCPERAEDIVLCDFGDSDYPVSFNPLDVNSIDQVEPTVYAVVEMLARELSLTRGGAPRALNLVKLALTALVEANLHLHDPDTKCTLLNVTTFFLDAEFRQLIVSFCDNVAVREMFNPDTGPFEQMSPKVQAELTQPIIRAFQELSRSDSFSAVFSSSQNRLDFAKLITENKIVLIKLARLHTQQQLGEFVGALVLPYLLSTLGDWGRQRDPETGEFVGRGCRVFVDEAPRLLGPDSAALQILAEARKWDLGLIFTGQYLAQFDKSVVAALLANTASKLCLTLDPSSATVIAKSIDAGAEKVIPADIASLPKYTFYGNVLSTTEEQGRTNSGPFKAQALPPLEIGRGEHHGLDDAQKVERDRIIAQSRTLISQAAKGNLRSDVEALKTALIVLHGKNVEMAATSTEVRGGPESPARFTLSLLFDKRPVHTAATAATVMSGKRVFVQRELELHLSRMAKELEIDDPSERRLMEAMGISTPGSLGLAVCGEEVALFRVEAGHVHLGKLLAQRLEIEKMMDGFILEIERDADEDREERRIWAGDPRNFGMFTDEGNLLVCELVTETLLQAQNVDTTRDEIEQLVRDGLRKLQHLGHSEAYDSAVKEQMTDVLAAAWKITTDTRLSFPGFESRWVPQLGRRLSDADTNR